MSEIRIIGPDGQRFVFPAGTDPEVMKAAMRRRYTGETRRGREMILEGQLPDQNLTAAQQYLARDQLQRDITEGRAAAATEAATGPENVAKERFYTGAQGVTLGAAPLIQGAANVPLAALMFPFLTEEQRAGRDLGQFVADMSGAGYAQARGNIERAREKRPLESAGIEIAGGLLTGKTVYDELGRRFLANQTGARGALVGAGATGQYEFLESEGDPAAAARGALIGAPVGAGVSKALEATAEPLGRMFRGEVPVPPEATNTLVGAGIGAAGPAETPEERARNIAIGAGLGYGGTKLGAMGRRTVGQPTTPASMPRTPRDAMRFETPGSPEYEAALAKGLDMSQAGRRQRGIDQGYDMDRVLYHGTLEDFDAFNPQKSEAKFGIHVGTSRAANDRARAKGEMEAGKLNNWQKGGDADPLINQQIMPIVAKFKKPLRLPDLGSWMPSAVANAIAQRYGIRAASTRPADVMRAIREAGYDSIVYKNVSEGRGSDSFIIFDPSEIRSVNAVFDPDNAASPILTAGLGGYIGRQSMRLPGVGPTAREAELAQSWRETTPIIQTARTAATSGEQAAATAVQSRAPGDIARAKDAKAALIREIETAQALRAGMDTPEDARLADALEALRENTSDPVLLSTQIGAAKTSLERLLTDLGRPTMPSTMTQAPQRPPLRRTFSAEEEARLAPEAPEPLSRTRYAEGEVPPVKGMGFGAGEPPKPVRDARAAGYEGTDTGESAEWLSAVRKGLPMDTPSRLARAKEMGFDTDTVLYHGTSEKFDAFEAGLRDPGVWMTTNITNASSYARGPDAQMHTLYIKPGKTLTIRAEWENGDIVFKSPDVDVDMSDWTNVDAAKYARRKGYDTLIFPDGNKTESDYTAVVFNPENIRSVDAAFDPEKAGSSTLLAAAPFAAVGGVGAGAAMGEED